MTRFLTTLRLTTLALAAVTLALTAAAACGALIGAGALTLYDHSPRLAAIFNGLPWLWVVLWAGELGWKRWERRVDTLTHH